MSVQLSVLAGPEVFGDVVLAYVTASLGMSGVSLESFLEPSQAILIGVVAGVVGVPVDDVRVISVAETGAPLLEVGVSAVFSNTNATTGASAASTAAAQLRSDVLDGSLASALARAGLDVSVALLEAVQVSEGLPPYSAPTITGSRAERAVVAWIGVLGETVETLGAGRQASLVTALAQHLGVDSEGVRLVEIAESRAEGADIEVLVEIADTSGGSSLSTMAAEIEDGVSSGSIGSLLVAEGMSVQLSVLVGPLLFWIRPAGSFKHPNAVKGCSTCDDGDMSLCVCDS
mmetsp:Transcript_43474/g.102681  ORF Transcript_43474/g.102681 Transcript_43474/m.102681 type:complete len:288 (-) Transcript_43474:1188-2051(-)